MKKVYLCTLVILAGLCASAQTANAVIYSENGELFTLYLNGEKKNTEPSANVKIGGLKTEFYQARVDFQDPKLPDFSNNSFAVKPGLEVTYVIKVNKKGEYVLRYFTEGPKSFDDAVANAASNDQVSDDAKRFAKADDAPDTADQTNSTSDPQSTTTVQTTTTTTKNASNPQGVNIGINAGGVNMGVNVNVEGMEDPDMGNMNTTVKIGAGNAQTTSTSTTTTTTQVQTSAAQPSTTKPATPAAVSAPVSQGKCANVMSATAFSGAKSNISSKPFEETKLSTAKQIIKTNCMSAAQIKEIMGVFDFEESKLDFAKYAYDYCLDTNNYYVVNEAFQFSASSDDLNEFLQSK